MPSDPLTERIARRVRELRTRAGMSLEALAERSALTPEAVSRIERGRTSPTARTIHRLAEGLEVSVIVLLGDGQAPTPPVADMSPAMREVFDELVGRPESDVVRARDVLRAVFADPSSRRGLPTE